MLAQLIQALYNIVDSYFVGRYSEDGLTALSIVFPIQLVITAIAVGTEINLVNRLAAQYPDKTVFCLDPVVCPCSTMYRIHPAYLA